MRKIQLLIAIFMILVMGTKASKAQNINEQVILQVCSSGDPYHHKRPHGKEMQRHLQVYLEDNKLSFDENESIEPFTLYLYSGNSPVYYQNVQEGVNQVELPANFKGEFYLMLVYDDIAYSGKITLN